MHVWAVLMEMQHTFMYVHAAIYFHGLFQELHPERHVADQVVEPRGHGDDFVRLSRRRLGTDQTDNQPATAIGDRAAHSSWFVTLFVYLFIYSSR